MPSPGHENAGIDRSGPSYAQRDGSAEGGDRGMISITESIGIDKPHTTVFAYACDYRNDPVWRSGVMDMRLEPVGPSRLGSKTHETLRFLFRSMVTEGEVTEFGADRRIAFRSTSGPMTVSGYREVVARDDGGSFDDGTTFTFHLEGTPTGPDALFAPIVERLFRRRVREDLRRLKLVLERE